MQNIVLDGEPEHDLDLSGPDSVDVNIVFERPDSVDGITITHDKNLSIRGTNYGAVKLVNANASSVLSLSGNMAVIGAQIDTDDWAGTCDPNGFRYITQPYLDVFAVQNITVLEGSELDFTGAILYASEFWVTFENTTGDTTINTGRIDTLAGVEFDNTATVHLQGQTDSDLTLLGQGTISLDSDVFVSELHQSDDVNLVNNGHEIIPIHGTSCILSIAPIPIDKDGIPIFEASTFGSVATFGLVEATDLRFSNDIPLINLNGTNVGITGYSNQLPVTKSNTIAAMPVDDDATITAYRNSGCVAYPITDDARMAVVVADGDTTVKGYINYNMLAWPLNANGVPIIKVKQ